jgi:hypothetical protein
MDVTQDDFNGLAMAEAKIAHLNGDLEAEERSLDSYVPPEEGDLDFEFRRISFALKAGRAQPMPGASRKVDFVNLPVGDRLSAANIVGDRGRWLRSVGRDEEAYEELAKSFSMAHSTFHRRGMFAKAMLLADLALAMEEGRLAAEWFLIGTRFRHSGRNIELQPETLRRRIVEGAGERVFPSSV